MKIYSPIVFSFPKGDDDNFSFLSPSFSKSSTYMMSNELRHSMRILGTSKLAIVSVITKGKKLFGIFPTFSLSWNSRIGHPSFPSVVVSHSLLIVISSMILILMVPLDKLIVLEIPLVIDEKYMCFPFWSFSSLMLLSFFLLTVLAAFMASWETPFGNNGIVSFRETRLASCVISVEQEYG